LRAARRSAVQIRQRNAQDDEEFLRTGNRQWAGRTSVSAGEDEPAPAPEDDRTTVPVYLGLAVRCSELGLAGAGPLPVEPLLPESLVAAGVLLPDDPCV
jgi:hypothetical protein